MKPLGLSADLRVQYPSKVEDAIWEAVQLAIEANWTPERMRGEIADAWREKLREDAKYAYDILSK